jgi:hypothetical protein
MLHNEMVLKIEKRQLENGVTVIEISGRIALGRESRNIEPEVVGAIAAGASTIIMDLAGGILFRKGHTEGRRVAHRGSEGQHSRTVPDDAAGKRDSVLS